MSFCPKDTLDFGAEILATGLIIFRFEISSPPVKVFPSVFTFAFEFKRVTDVFEGIFLH